MGKHIFVEFVFVCIVGRSTCKVNYDFFVVIRKSRIIVVSFLFIKGGYIFTEYLGAAEGTQSFFGGAVC